MYDVITNDIKFNKSYNPTKNQALLVMPSPKTFNTYIYIYILDVLVGAYSWEGLVFD